MRAVARAGIVWPWRAVVLARDLGVGALLCLTPVTALLALGWIARRTGGEAQPGWVMGPRGAGWVARMAGGFGANIRAGVVTATGLAVWTLPFAGVWALAWWAGWDNSFNKGYEQAAVGPMLWFAALAVALPVLTVLPFAVAQGGLAPFGAPRRAAALAVAAGWRTAGVGMLAAVLGLPYLALRGMPVFVEEFVPGFATMTPDDQAGVARAFALAGGVWAFAAVWALRRAGRWALAGARPGRRWLAPLWLLLAAAGWAVVVAQLLVAQFLNHDFALWVTHPFWLLPWAG